jgi:hypothetical protein
MPTWRLGQYATWRVEEALRKLVVAGPKAAKIVHTLTLYRRYASLPLLSLSLFLSFSRRISPTLHRL